MKCEHWVILGKQVHAGIERRARSDILSHQNLNPRVDECDEIFDN